MSARGVVAPLTMEPAEPSSKKNRYGVHAECSACRFSVSEYATGIGWRLVCERYGKPARNPCMAFEREPGADDYQGEAK